MNEIGLQRVELSLVIDGSWKTGQGTDGVHLEQQAQYRVGRDYTFNVSRGSVWTLFQLYGAATLNQGLPLFKGFRELRVGQAILTLSGRTVWFCPLLCTVCFEVCNALL